MLLFTNIDSIRSPQQWEENNCRIVIVGQKYLLVLEHKINFWLMVFEQVNEYLNNVIFVDHFLSM